MKLTFASKKKSLVSCEFLTRKYSKKFRDVDTATKKSSTPNKVLSISTSLNNSEKKIEKE
jgi:hypothetical protein